MAGTVTLVGHYRVGALRRIVYDCTADAAAGTFPATVIEAFEGNLVGIETNPGAVAPTDNYDIALTNAEGTDKLAGAGQNRDTANTEEAASVFASSSVPVPVDGDEVLTLAITNNSVNSATIRVTFYYLVAG